MGTSCQSRPTVPPNFAASQPPADPQQRAKLDGGVEPSVEPNLTAILSDINMPEMDWLDLLGEVTDATRS